MKTIRINSQRFELNSFLEASLYSDKNIVRFPFGVHWGNIKKLEAERYVNSLEIENENEKMPETFKVTDTLEFLKEDSNNYVFAVFTSCNIEEPNLCVDGNTYKNETSEDEESKDLEQEKDSGDTGSYGYIVMYNNGELIINSAIHDIGGGCFNDSIWEYCVSDGDNCGLFDKPMVEYLKRFY